MTGESRYNGAKAAFFEVLQTLGAEPFTPISNYEIGPPMIMRGFTEHEIVNMFFSLQVTKEIELLPGNRLQILSEL
ncbi:hypothetical protein DTW90_37435 [Neorhizobium sp. P12A]|uniref:hypothetical protein n=1 Tax=Rhizobium/Agrobacterium group TaxID=227290 RepID=UPI0010472B97|nr:MULTISPECIES: hypothetical protein [Rhizobium/Agrobacterium group]KAA0679593.1 hypothetical protein DTW90_37435 [Neorhizobium sp. P12A]TCR67847.1 hypothetical protein EV561_1495 [Rhizobium sp. BK376]